VKPIAALIFIQIVSAMLTYQEFEQFNEKQRANQVWRTGTFLELTRITDQLIIDLYSVEDFYVEVFFDRSSEEVLYIKPFSNLNKLAPYLEQIDISNLIPA
jgi:nitrate reductase assembly molybdenum cofactor insertion protein NarJ